MPAGSPHPGELWRHSLSGRVVKVIRLSRILMPDPSVHFMEVCEAGVTGSGTRLWDHFLQLHRLAFPLAVRVVHHG